MDKSIAPPKANVARIKQKIEESEYEKKCPGGSYLKDMLRATAYYLKHDLRELLKDL